MDNKAFNSLLSAYIDGELCPADKARVAAQLKSRPELAKLCNELRKVRKLLQEMPQAQVPERVREMLGDRLARLGKATNGTFEPPAFLNELLRHPEHLLNAYIDGELPQNQREYVQDHLLHVDANRKTLAELQQTANLVGSLERRPAPAGIVGSVLDQIRNEEQHSVASESQDGQKRPFAELLSAYADDEIDPRRRKLVVRKLKKSPKSQRRLEEYQTLKAELASLPRVSAPAGSVEKVVDWLKNHEPGTRPELVAHAKPQPIAASQTLETRAKKERRNLLRTAGLLAASLVLGYAVISFQFPQNQPPYVVQVAERDDRPSEPAPVSKNEPQPPQPVNEEPTVVAENDQDRPDDTAVAEETPRIPKFYVLPLEQLTNIRPGQLIDVLNEKQVKLVCLDVERVYNRLRVVMMNNNVPVVATEDAIQQHEKSGSNQLYVLDISTTPDQLTDILAELWESERRDGPLVSSVDIDRPSEELIEDVNRANDAVVQSDKPEQESKKESGKGTLQVPTIELPQRALGNVPSTRVSKALELTVSKDKPTGRSTVRRPAEQRSETKPPRKVAEAPKPQPEKKPKDERVRVLFVLEPRG